MTRKEKFYSRREFRELALVVVLLILLFVTLI